MSDRTAEDITRELLSVLPLLNRIVVEAVRREAGEETTMPQFRCLAHLAEAPLTLSALAKRRHVTLQSMGEVVQALVERGWVARTPDPRDRRQALLALTAAGRAHYERAHERSVRTLAPLVARLSAGELGAVQIALPALHRVLTGDEDA